ncbi:unnamed protein product [Acanthoscelides obtectus]|uniref:Uncharacterized protein n=1 Tax=Acanthoscelides obtectus TaxID=200917 RepID=A0A9P0LSU7_ACAOB|nr:unnamed protein product [Acanthoscelides obtectus]CAK1624264.1 hypothetical protein AOBTE_LOCUS2453 [Acanthoscelides obtectus]
MDHERLKKIRDSLKAFSRERSLLNMTRDELAHIPKEVLICCTPNEIAHVWNKPPEHLKEDADIQRFQFWWEHRGISGSDDEADGPSPRKMFCCYCNMQDINVKNTSESNNCCNQ